MYNAVGIDVSKGKSTVAVLQPGGTVIRKPFDVSHTSHNLNELADYLGSLEGSTKIVMECTGRYHEPMLKALYEAGLFVSVANPHLIKNFGNNSLRKTLFQIMTTLLQNATENDPVYRFLDKKWAQGKPYYVYMTAGANKFLRIYYGKVKECLRNLEQAE